MKRANFNQAGARPGRGEFRPENRTPRETVLVQRDLAVTLEFKNGVGPTAKRLADFFVEIRRYCMQHMDKSKIYQIISTSGTVESSYPVITAPKPLPAGEPTYVQKETWKSEYIYFQQDSRMLEEHKRQLLGVILKHISRECVERVMESTEGKKAYETTDPLNFMKEMYRQLLGEGRIDDAQNLSLQRKRWAGICQKLHESEFDYYGRSKATLEALKEAFIRVGTTTAEVNSKMPSPQEQAVDFIKGLGPQYKNFKRYYMDGLKTWPTTLDDAHEQASKYNTYHEEAARKPAAGDPREPAVGFLAKTDSRDPGPKPKKDKSHIICHNCQQTGHYKNQCRNPRVAPAAATETASSVAAAVAQQKADKGKAGVKWEN